MTRPFRLLLVVGARPNFMKIAPIVRELGRFPDRFAPTLVHTGQHYDAAMSEVFFTEWGLPRPDVDPGVGAGSHGTNVIAGTDPRRIVEAFPPARSRAGQTARPQFWDGTAAERIVDVLRREADAAAAVEREQRAGATC